MLLFGPSVLARILQSPDNRSTSWVIVAGDAAVAAYPTAGVNIMLSHVVDGRYVAGYTLWLRFSDGAEGEVDLTKELHGPVFERLNDPDFFRRFTIHPEVKTLVWPNGADFAPEFLRSSLRVAA